MKFVKVVIKYLRGCFFSKYIVQREAAITVRPPSPSVVNIIDDRRLIGVLLCIQRQLTFDFFGGAWAFGLGATKLL